MPTSAYMNRENPQVPQLQASFIKHLVQPLYIAYEKAGILPGEWVEGEDEDEDGEEDGERSDTTKESINNSDDAIETSPSSVKIKNKNKELATSDSTATTTTSEDVADNDTEDGATGGGNKTDKKVAYCIMSDNIKTKYEKWLRIIEEEKEEQSTEQDDDDDAEDGGGDTSDDT